eukprot:scaffold1315_cov405-Prasinococcus_capsulatus_cf.AAC.9
MTAVGTIRLIPDDALSTCFATSSAGSVLALTKALLSYSSPTRRGRHYSHQTVRWTALSSPRTYRVLLLGCMR